MPSFEQMQLNSLYIANSIFQISKKYLPKQEIAQRNDRAWQKDSEGGLKGPPMAKSKKKKKKKLGHQNNELIDYNPLNKIGNVSKYTDVNK